MITQVVVDKDDPAIQNPTKFIGPRYTKDEINPLAQNSDGPSLNKIQVNGEE